MQETQKEAEALRRNMDYTTTKCIPRKESWRLYENKTHKTIGSLRTFIYTCRQGFHEHPDANMDTLELKENMEKIK